MSDCKDCVSYRNCTLTSLAYWCGDWQEYTYENLRALAVSNAAKYVKAKSEYKFNRSRNICMGLMFGLCFALLSVGVMFEIF
jgi:hypothetical protein